MKFEIDIVRERLTDRLFVRGVGYHEGGRVDVVGVDGDTVLAHVTGEDTYAVEMTPEIGGFGAHCTCPAFEDWQVCKHLAAVALTANGMTASEIETARTRFALIREGLALDSKDELIERIMGLIKRRPDLFHELEGGEPDWDEDA